MAQTKCLNKTRKQENNKKRTQETARSFLVKQSSIDLKSDLAGKCP